MIRQDYEGLGAPVRRWDSLASFLDSADLDDAVHVVGLASGNHLDFHVRDVGRGESAQGCVPVFFSGALPNRQGTAAPYFSGARMSAALGLAMVAFSDPTLNLDDSTPLAWYAGTPGDGVQSAITEVLQWLAAKSGRELLLIGGSGGGFAALYYASRVGRRASAFAWNPQTDLLKYTPEAVGAYLRAAGMDLPDYRGTPSEQAEASRWLLSHGVEHVLPADDRAARVFVLQNATDWHVETHLAPFLERGGYEHRGRGYYSSPAGHGALILHYGEGHAVPSQALLAETLRSLVQPSQTPRATFNRLVDQGLVSAAGAARLPGDLRGDVARIEALANVRPTRQGTSLVAKVEGLPPGYGRIKYRFSSVDRSGARTYHGVSHSPEMVIDAPDAAAVEVALSDGFGHPLTTLHALCAVDVATVQRAATPETENGREHAFEQPSAGRRATDSARPRVFIYGSCVTRDAFALAEAPPLVDYVARSSLGSAFSSRDDALVASVDVELNPSAFQRRMVQTDLGKTLADRLRSAEFDHLVVDFIDERLPLVRRESGYVTHSPELSRCGFTPSRDMLVRPGSTEHLEAFRSGFDTLLRVVPASRVLVNRVFWASRDTTGALLPDQAQIAHHNAVLVKLYAHAASTGVGFVDHPAGAFVADAGHKWGISPFHYAAPLYESTLAGIAAAGAEEDATGADPGISPPMCVVLETLFCDDEHDPQILDRYLAAYLLTLRSLAAVDVPPGVDAHFVTYLSADKTDELAAITRCVATFPPGRRERFAIVQYQHPDEGYGNEGATHIDLVKNPNKHAPRRDHLFAQALDELRLDESRALLRIAIDDDDAWLPWQLREVTKAAADALKVTPHRPSVVGLANHVVVVAEERATADFTRFARVISGNKFYIAPPGMFGRLRTSSPWAIPEVFSEAAGERFDAAGFDMLLSHENVPGFLYFRRGGNLTPTRKDVYYQTPPVTIGLDSLEDALALPELPDYAAGVHQGRFTDLERVFEVTARREGERLRVGSNLSRMRLGATAEARFAIMAGAEVVHEVAHVSSDEILVEADLPADVFVKGVLYADGRAVTTVRSRGTV